ncbi:MAG: sialidase family protein [Actinomycetota bacterium]
MIAAMRTVEGVVILDIEEETILGPGDSVPDAVVPKVELPRVVTAAQNGATIVAIVERRPPLAISRDGGATWTEYGGGLLPGFAIAIANDDPDRMLYAARNRLYLSLNGGVFWRALLFELPDVLAIGWID